MDFLPAFAEAGIVRIVLRYALSLQEVLQEAAKSQDGGMFPWVSKAFGLRDLDAEPKELVDAVASAVCARGCLSSVVWFTRRYRESITLCGQYLCLHDAAIAGRSQVIRHLLASFDNLKPSLGTLEAMCSGGHLSAARALVKAVDYTEFHCSRVASPGVVEMIARTLGVHHRVGTAKWLADFFGYSLARLLSEDRFWRVVKKLCERGSISTLRRVFGIWGLQKGVSARVDLGRPDVALTLLRSSLLHYRPKATTLIFETFHFVGEDMLRSFRCADEVMCPPLLAEMCSFGHFDLCKHLIKKFEIKTKMLGKEFLEKVHPENNQMWFVREVLGL